MKAALRTRRRPMTGVALVVVATLLALGWAGCHAHDHAHGHEHGHGAKEEGLPALSVTIWTEQSELFFEHEPLVVGRSSRFALHVTRLPAFVAATDGSLRVTIRMAGGASGTARASAPASPGIFRATLEPPSAGACTLSVELEHGDHRETIDAGPCTAHGSEAEARAATGAETPADGIAFTKEQQWEIELATTVAALRELQPSLRATAEIEAIPSHEARLGAPASGRVVLPSPTPILGAAVERGQLLASIVPSLGASTDRATIDADVEAARIELGAAEAALARAERLFAEQAVPERSVEEARARAEVARTRVAAARGRLETHAASTAGTGAAPRGSFLVRSLIAGTLVGVFVAQGQSVTDGEPLFRVVDLGRIWLVARIFEPDLPSVERAPGAWFTVEGFAEPFVLAELGGRLVTVGHLIDPRSRTAPAVFELDNPDRRLRIGQFAQAFVATGLPRRVLAVPESALLDDAGRPIAFVQLEGERFVRRAVKTGLRAKGWVEVLSGIAEGERVVSRGAYPVRLAAASGAIPEHGHVH